MVIKVGVNGFGRIGRIIFRTCFPKANIEISAINDPAIDIEYICYLMKFDSTHGKFNGDITFSEDEIMINGNKKIKVFREKLPSRIPWQALGVQYVVEASGMFATIEKASGHLLSTSVKRVIVTAPSADIPMMIIGVNEEQISKDQKIISCASSTLYCLAPIIKILESNYGVAEGFVTSIHAMTPSLKPLDGLCLRGRHWRDHRSIHQNIIPAATGACKALGKIIPQVKDKFCGLAFRVPIVNVSVLDITIRLNKNTTLQEIAAQIEKARIKKMKNIINTSYAETVSSDFMNDENSCILDVNSSLQLTPRSFKLICWYENEYSYACRVIDTIMFSEEQLKDHKLCNTLFVSTKPRSNRPQSIGATYKDQDILNKINYENNLRIFNSIFLESGLKEKLNRKIAKEQLHCIRFDKHLSSFKTNKVFNSDRVLTKQCDNKNSVIYTCDKLCKSDIESNNISRERLAMVKKELAEITNKTKNLLKQSIHETVEINKQNVLSIKEPETNEKINHTPNLKDTTNDIVMNKKSSKTFKITITKSSSTLPSETNNNINQITATNEDVINETGSKLLITDKEGLEAVVDINVWDKLGNDNANYKNPNIDKELNQVNVQEITDFDMEPKSNANISLNDIQTTFTTTTHNGSNILRAEENQCDRNSNILSNDNINMKFVAVSTSNKIILDSNKSDLSTIVLNNENCDDIEETHEKNKKRIMSTIMKKISKDSKVSIPRDYNNFKLMNRDENTTKKDLFDKLESDTDSDNSIKIYETKSQVIDITDISSSTDDFARLDKICRIIEISDELSDQLLSALEIKGESSNKKWSLKDLCEKIKLDEFCQKVFGQ